MTIRYFLRPNKMSADADNYIALVRPIGTLDQNDIIERMQQKGSSVTREDAMAAVHLYHETILQGLSEGYNIVTDTVNFSASIRGTFSGPDAPFRRDRHTIRSVVRPGKRLRGALQNAPVTRLEPTSRAPLPQSFYDVNSDSANRWLTPGGVARLNGRRLKYNPADEPQGIFFLNEAHEETAVTQTIKISPSELFFIVPPLPPGTYYVVVRNVPHQLLLEGQLHKPLTIA